MTTIHRVTAVRLFSGGYVQEHITHLQLDGWLSITKADAVHRIDAGEYLYTQTTAQMIAGTSTPIEVVRNPYLTEAYVRTDANDTTNDNLLSLPRF